MSGQFHIPPESRKATTFHADANTLKRAGDVADAVGIPLSRALQLFARECARAGKVPLASAVPDADCNDPDTVRFRIELLDKDREGFKAACRESGISMKQALTRFLVASAESGGLALTMKVEPEGIMEAGGRIEYAYAKFREEKDG